MSALERIGSAARDAAGYVGGPFHEVVEAPRENGTGQSYRRWLLFLLMLLIALDYADRAAVGALGPELKKAFSLSNTELGLVASTFSLVAAGATLPSGLLVDRKKRTAIVAGAIGLWTLAMGATGAAIGFGMLLAARIALGCVTAVARPAVASMTGDVFATRVRGRALSVVDSGELLGNGTGYIVAGLLAVVITWRGVFWLLAAAGLALGWAIWRLREPPRSTEDENVEEELDGDASRLAEDDDEIEPREEVVLDGDQAGMPLWRAIVHVLRVRTIVVVIVASATASFFFAGLRIFAVVFAVKAYGVSRPVASLSLLAVGAAAVAGVIAGGQIGDWLLRRGNINGRLTVSTAAYLLSAAAFVPAFFVHSYYLALPLYVVAGGALVVPTAPLDAVRLDVMHPQLRGRAEGVRNTLLIGAEAAGPLLFGFLSDTLDGGGIAGLRYAFLVGVGTIALAALVLQVARRYYGSELASVNASLNAR